MPTPFDTARQAILASIPFGETISISRGTSSVASGIPAKAAGTSYATTDRDGLTVHTAGQDFIVRMSSLSSPPQPRDIVTWDGVQYTVVQPQRDEPCWRVHDRSGSIIRIHTKRRGQASAGGET